MTTHPLNILSNDSSCENKPWYSAGLRFKCTECGKCCTGAPGYAWVTAEEIQAIADYLKLSVKEFSKKYLRFSKGRFALVERKNYDCIFLKDKKCTIYPVRPKQCRTFPWWIQNLSSPEEWEKAAQDCEGISQEAPLVPFDLIQSQLLIDKNDKSQ